MGWAGLGQKRDPGSDEPVTTLTLTRLLLDNVVLVCLLCSGVFIGRRQNGLLPTKRAGKPVFQYTEPSYCHSYSNSYCTVSQKNKTLNSCPWLPQMLTDFQNSFANTFIGEFVTKSYSNVPPLLKYVSTLPCEKWMLENWRQSDIGPMYCD